MVPVIAGARLLAPNGFVAPVRDDGSMTNPPLLESVTTAGPPPSTARTAAVVVHGRDQDPEYMLGGLEPTVPVGSNARIVEGL